jgi:hypothetical protein
MYICCSICLPLGPATPGWCWVSRALKSRAPSVWVEMLLLLLLLLLL